MLTGCPRTATIGFWARGAPSPEPPSNGQHWLRSVPPEPSLFGEQMAGAALTAQMPNRRYLAAGLHYLRTQAIPQKTGRGFSLRARLFAVPFILNAYVVA